MRKVFWDNPYQCSLVTTVASVDGNELLFALSKISRSSLYYRHRQPEKDADVLDEVRRLSRRHPRFGARRIRVLLKREGIVI
jgi:hypothetical protein